MSLVLQHFIWPQHHKKPFSVIIDCPEALILTELWNLSSFFTTKIAIALDYTNLTKRTNLLTEKRQIPKE